MSPPCTFCGFPCSARDCLPMPGLRGGYAHADCSYNATLDALRAGQFDGRAAVLLRRRLTGPTTPNKENDRG